MKGLPLKRRRDIARQRGQFAAVLVTIVLGVMMFAASYDAYRNLEASYNGTYDRLAFADMTITGGSSSLADAVAALDGVAVVESRRQADVPLQVGDDVFLGRVVSLTSDINTLDVVAGELPSGGAEGLAETHLAEHFGLEPGDTVTVLGTLGVTVTGAAVSPEYLWPARSSQE
ncbi:MAG: cell division protein FtsX, partial [Actinomycetales bacterium]|nr:cell division protein FtsX [Actinomycetales bacterium]